MTFAVNRKNMGLLFAGLFVALCASFTFSTPTHAANATWVNRATVKYETQYFIDTDTFDGNFTFMSTQGTCQDLIVFNHNSGSSDAVDNFNFYYSDGSNGRFSPAAPNSASFVDKEPLTGNVNAGTCSEKSSTSVGVDNPNNARRINFVLNSATRRITNVINGTLFDYAGTTPGSWSVNGNRPIYVNASDPSICKATIVMVEADPFHTGLNNGPFGSGVESGSSTLYTGVGEGRDEDIGLERISEAFNDTVNFIPGGTKCKMNDSNVEAPGGSYPLLAVGSGTLGTGDYVEWLFAGGFDNNGVIQTNGDRKDDAYIVFVGNATDNVIPPSAGGTPGGTTPGAGAGSPVEVCQDNVSGMGHILCPLLNGFDSIMQTLYNNIIVPFLTIPPLTTIVGLQQVWQNVLNIANILFVIVFFIIMFSQATSIGISNYGIKSLLPRLIAIAILANLSFYVCVLAVDFSNILAAGISSLVAVSLQGLPQVNVDFNLQGSLSDLFASLGTISLIGMAVAAQGGVIAVIAALGIPIVLATVVTVLLLILRLILIVGFVAISPIIFMGFILPGTTRISSRLLMGFLNLLWVGPIIMALVALNAIVAYVISLVLA